MWHMALREVDNLEEALKSYQDNRHVDLVQKNTEDVSWVSATTFIAYVVIYIELSLSIC
jgi:hypothetical protein